MNLCHIALRDFRNYAAAELTLDPGINVITGRNAQGKTNLLEAVYLLSAGRSFRTRFDREMIAFEAERAEVCATVFAEGRAQDLRILLRRGQRKQIFQNKVKKTGSELSGGMKTVLFCPEDLQLIRAGAAERRRMLDLAIAQLRPGYARVLSDYRSAYENKLRILRDYADQPAMLDSLDAFSDTLARLSAQIIRYRASFALRLGAAAAPIHRRFSGADELLETAYHTVSTVTDCTAPAQTIYAQILEHQRAHRAAELASGQVLTGAHKDDLEISINGRPARSFASQGQTRTAALSLKLAEREIFLAESGEPPILLLDDVLSELDARRQEFVLNRIGGGQTLITCCEGGEIVEKTGGKVLFVEQGTVREG